MNYFYLAYGSKDEEDWNYLGLVSAIMTKMGLEHNSRHNVKDVLKEDLDDQCMKFKFTEFTLTLNITHIFNVKS